MRSSSAPKKALSPKVPVASSSGAGSKLGVSSLVRPAVLSIRGAVGSSASFAVNASRSKLIQRLQDRGIRDLAVLKAIAKIDRHLFVDQGLASLAYQDEALPIGFGQTISKPSTVARMLELLCEPIQPARRLKAKVLEVGTGCGYQAACMAKIFGETYSIERVKGLHELARQNLRPLRLANLRLVFGDGYLGLPSAAPFDAIVVAAAASEVPQALLEQLKIGARLVIPVGLQQQVLQVIDRVSEQDYQLMTLDAVRFVPLLDGTR